MSLKKMNILLIVLFIVAGSLSSARNEAPTQAADHQVAKQAASYFLAVDRLHFYIQNLADTLDKKGLSQTVETLRSITPEDIFNKNIDVAKLADTTQWQNLVFELANQKSVHVTFAELEWNYNFFKNKLRERFVIKDQKPSKEVEPLLDGRQDPVVMRSIPKIQGQKYLLDVERYVAEKTSRAIIWDAISNDRDFEFHIGTLREFKERIARNNIQIISEVQPMARNYNKIYLTYSPATGRYAYVINMISGDDRIKHLIAQLRLIKFNGKSYVHATRDKVRVYGNALDFHKEQERKLLDLYQRLPKADKVVIGQKGAIQSAMAAAGMLSVVTENSTVVRESLELEGSKKSRFENLVNKGQEISSFSLEALHNSPVKIEDAYAKVGDPIDRNYSQFTSEQASHEFSDYLLLDSENKIQRWRVISAVWGDEIIPIAEALKKSGHQDIVYIGTAGAIAGKGIKVGDVVSGGKVQTHSGKELSFSPATLTKGLEAKTVTVGQVYTPFDETDTWLQRKGSAMDIVEVETGYLREVLGEQTKLETYFLISDVVGSDNETLAHAAQSSSKRKKGQIRLLENLFVANGIKSPVSNFEMLPNNAQLKTMVTRLTALRPSRDLFSILQVAQVAVRDGLTETSQLEQALKQQPNFERPHINFALVTLGSLLVEIQSKIPKNKKVGFISEVLSNGTFNPESAKPLEIYVEGLSPDELKILIGSERLARFETALKRSFQISFVDANDPRTKLGTTFRAQKPDDLFKIYEEQTLKKAGFTSELDPTGRHRLREIPGMARGVRCEQALF